MSVTPDDDSSLYLCSEPARIAREEAGTEGVIGTDALTSKGKKSSNTDSEEEGATSVSRVGGRRVDAKSFAEREIASGIKSIASPLGSIGGYLGLETDKGRGNVNISTLRSSCDVLVFAVTVLTDGGRKDNVTLRERIV